MDKERFTYSLIYICTTLKVLKTGGKYGATVTNNPGSHSAVILFIEQYSPYLCKTSAKRKRGKYLRNGSGARTESERLAFGRVYENSLHVRAVTVFQGSLLEWRYVYTVCMFESNAWIALVVKELNIIQLDATTINLKIQGMYLAKKSTNLSFAGIDHLQFTKSKWKRGRR